MTKLTMLLPHAVFGTRRVFATSFDISFDAQVRP
jgi:hypothetical protein